MDHYLLSLRMQEAGTDLHCYLMSNDKADLELSMNRMMDVAEEIIGRPVGLPILLSTGPLQKGTVRKIRALIAGRSSEAEQLMKEATSFHTTIWEMEINDPQTSQLMEIH